MCSRFLFFDRLKHFFRLASVVSGSHVWGHRGRGNGSQFILSYGRSSSSWRVRGADCCSLNQKTGTDSARASSIVRPRNLVNKGNNLILSEVWVCAVLVCKRHAYAPQLTCFICFLCTCMWMHLSCQCVAHTSQQQWTKQRRGSRVQQSRRTWTPELLCYREEDQQDEHVLEMALAHWLHKNAVYTINISFSLYVRHLALYYFIFIHLSSNICL